MGEVVEVRSRERGVCRVVVGVRGGGGDSGVLWVGRWE